MPRAGETLAVAAPTAFGFLENDIAGISYEGRGEITEREWEDNPTGLRVNEGETLSLIGGDIETKKGTYCKVQKTDEQGDPVFEEEEDEDGLPILDEAENPVLAYDESGNPVPVTETAGLGDIVSPGGRINLAAAASEGEVIPAESDLNITSSEKGIGSLSGKSLADGSGTRGGSIFVRGGEFVAENSTVQSKTLGDGDGGVIDIRADTVSVSGTDIIANAEGSGNASDINITAAHSVTVSGENPEAEYVGIFSRSGIDTVPLSKSRIEKIQLSVTKEIYFIKRIVSKAKRYDYELVGDELGDGGNIRIEAENISFQDGTGASVSAYGGGSRGNLTIIASESVNFSGESSTGEISFFVASTYSRSENAGDAGNLVIEAGDISFSDGAFISSTAFGRGGDPFERPMEGVGKNGGDAFRRGFSRKHRRQRRRGSVGGGRHSP